MINVMIEKNQSGIITSFEMSGHANFAKRGSDIVCAAASAVSFGTLNAVHELTNIIPIVEQGRKGGYLYATFPAELTNEQQDKIQLLLQAMIVSLTSIELSYSKFIKISFQIGGENR